MCIDIVEIWFGFANGKYRQNLTALPARETPVISCPDDNLCKCQGVVTKLGTCIDNTEI